MDFELTEAQKALQATVRRFARNEVEPLAYEIDRDERFPRESFKKAAELGLLGITIPEEYGGSGGSYTDMMIVAEQLSAVCASTCVACLANACLFSDNVFRNGSEYLKRKYLPPMCAGEAVGGVAMTEPDAGSDVTAMKMRAEARGDHYIMDASPRVVIPLLLEQMQKGGIEDIPVVVGGIVPEKDELLIKEMGVKEVFHPHTPLEKVVERVKTIAMNARERHASGPGG